LPQYIYKVLSASGEGGRRLELGISYLLSEDKVSTGSVLGNRENFFSVKVDTDRLSGILFLYYLGRSCSGHLNKHISVI
jgi:hypothetical protein